MDYTDLILACVALLGFSVGFIAFLISYDFHLFR